MKNISNNLPKIFMNLVVAISLLIILICFSYFFKERKNIYQSFQEQMISSQEDNSKVISKTKNILKDATTVALKNNSKVEASIAKEAIIETEKGTAKIAIKGVFNIGKTIGKFILEGIL